MRLPAKSIVILVASCLSVSNAETTENLPPELTLFTSAEDQQALELIQSAVTLSVAEEKANEINRLKPDEEAEATDHTGNSVRYDGVVMKGSQVLGLWFGGSRVPDIEEYTSTDLSVVGSTGQLQLKKGERSVILFAGDYYSPKDVAIVNPVITLQEVPDDHSAEASQSELGISELDQIEPDQIDSDQTNSGMDESSLSDSN